MWRTVRLSCASARIESKFRVLRLGIARGEFGGMFSRSDRDGGDAGEGVSACVSRDPRDELECEGGQFENLETEDSVKDFWIWDQAHRPAWQRAT